MKPSEIVEMSRPNNREEAINYLVTCKTRVRKQKSEDTSQDSNGGASCHAERMHDRFSVNPINISNDIHNHYLAQCYAFSYQVRGLCRQRHHKRREGHGQRDSDLGESAGSYEPQAQDGGTYGLDRSVEREPAGSQGVAQSGVVYDDENDGHIGKCREAYEASYGGWSEQGDTAYYGTG